MRVTEFRLKLYPKDYQKSREFYEELFSKPIKEWDRGPEDKGAMFQVGPAILELLTPGSEALQGTDLSLEVEDVKKLAESLQGKANIVHELRHNEWGDTSFCISDPEGYEITFFTKD